MNHYNNNKNISEILNISPTEDDLEKFNIWKKTKRKNILKLIVVFFILLLLAGVLLYPVVVDARVFDKIFGIICYAIFILLELYFLNKYIKMKSWTMNRCNYGIIIDKYRSFHHSIDARPLKSASGNNTVSHLIVLTEGRKVNINTCSNDEYRTFNINDEVIVFLADDKKIYVIKK